MSLKLVSASVCGNAVHIFTETALVFPLETFFNPFHSQFYLAYLIRDSHIRLYII